MAKLETRQKIIIGVMGIVILYAAVEFLLPKKKAATIDVKQQTQELNTLVTTLSVGMGKGAGNASPLIISRVEKEWPRDPFLDTKSYRAWVQPPKEQVREKEPAPVQNINFTYTGYLEVNRKRMAIINGIEYKEGEALDIKGYILRTASPEKVVIENRTTKTTLTVPLME